MGDKVMLLMYLKKMFSFLDQGHNSIRRFYLYEIWEANQNVCSRY